MVEITQLPHALAVINCMTVVLLLAGYGYIRSGNIKRHRVCMLVSVGMAALFLVIYTYYHVNAGLAKFGGEGVIRPVYFTILILHVIGAITLVPMVPLTLLRALRERFDAHKQLARWTWPLWMYVSVSGVVVYVMAIHIYPYSG
jgi:uncharacterized membrane protein YozB (DUF420 family)